MLRFINRSLPQLLSIVFGRYERLKVKNFKLDQIQRSIVFVVFCLENPWLTCYSKSSFFFSFLWGVTPSVDGNIGVHGLGCAGCRCCSSRWFRCRGQVYHFVSGVFEDLSTTYASVAVVVVLLVLMNVEFLALLSLTAKMS